MERNEVEVKSALFALPSEWRPKSPSSISRSRRAYGVRGTVRIEWKVSVFVQITVRIKGTFSLYAFLLSPSE